MRHAKGIALSRHGMKRMAEFLNRRLPAAKTPFRKYLLINRPGSNWRYYRVDIVRYRPWRLVTGARHFRFDDWKSETSLCSVA